MNLKRCDRPYGAVVAILQSGVIRVARDQQESAIVAIIVENPISRQSRHSYIDRQCELKFGFRNWKERECIEVNDFAAFP